MANIKKNFNFRNGVQVDDDNLLVTATGLVGIGTTVPTEALDVRGNVKIVGDATITNATVGVLTITEVAPTQIIGAGVSIKSGIVTAQGTGIVTFYGDARYLQGMPTSQWEDTNAGLGVSSIYNTGGTVGIATTNPQSTLQVGNNVDVGERGVGISSVGNINASGIVTATTFKGALTGAASQVTVAANGDNTTYRVPFTSAATGSASIYTDTSDGITYNPSTGTISAQIFSGSGASLTNLNASNLASGTVPTARLGSGTASSSTFLRGDSTFQTVITDLVNDTSPQLGGNLATNGNLIKFPDSNGSNNKLTFGNGDDIEFYYATSNLYITQKTGDIILENTGGNTSNQIYIKGKANTNSIVVHGNGAVELYDQSSGSAVKRLETTSSGVTVTGTLTATTFSGSVSNISGAITGDANNRVLVSDGDGTVTAEADLTYTSNRLTSRHTASGTTYPIFLQNRTNGDSRVGIQMIATGSDISDGQFAAIEARGPQAGNTRHQLYFKTCVSGGTPTDRFYVDSDGHVLPAANNTYDLGDASSRWRNVYTNDLNLSNEGSKNDVVGTWGNYTIQEGESDLFLINNRSGKKYKFNLTEVS